jgi:tmRNA-binding protein
MVTNKRAYFEYEFSEEYECGLKLLGTEVKSVNILIMILYDFVNYY